MTNDDISPEILCFAVRFALDDDEIDDDEDDDDEDEDDEDGEDDEDEDADGETWQVTALA